MSETEEQKKDRTMLIVAINLLVMVTYTLAIRIEGGNGYGVIVLAFALGAHILICLLLSPFILSRAFIMSALAVLLIGLSTCVVAYSIH